LTLEVAGVTFALLSVGGWGALVTFLLLMARPGFELEDTLLVLVEVALCGGGNNIAPAADCGVAVPSAAIIVNSEDEASKVEVLIFATLSASLICDDLFPI